MPVGRDHTHGSLLGRVGSDILALHDEADYLEARHDALGFEFLKGTTR
ncbi:hypothetical protein ACFQ3Z_36410 [Streptomyces nogalater]